VTVKKPAQTWNKIPKPKNTS